MSISRRDYLREKFDNFKKFLEEKTPKDFMLTDDVERFKNQTEEQIITFAITHLLPYKNSIDYPTQKVCELFGIDFYDKSISLVIANYLELFIKLIQ